MLKEDQPSLLQNAEALRKESTQKEGPLVLEVSSRTNKQMSC